MDSMWHVWDALRNLLQLVQFWKREKQPWRSLKHASCRLKVTLLHLHGCFSLFLNCTNTTESCKASQIVLRQSQDKVFPLLLWYYRLQKSIIRGRGDEKCLLFRNISFLYPLKTSENLWFAEVFKEGTGLEQLAKMD